MNPKEFKEEMEKLVDLSRSDPEIAHGEADEIMCGILTELGYGEGACLFEDMWKWYA